MACACAYMRHIGPLEFLLPVSKLENNEFQGANSLDNEVINSQSLSSFKKKLKIKLLSKYENSS